VKAAAFGYPNETILLLACDKNSSQITRDTIWLDIKVNEKITLRNIYYDFDKWNILPDAAQELDRLVALMKENPGMKVELNAHTDDRGTEVYNMRLSQLRAQSAVDYIISRGIDQSKIQGTGYGKSQLLHKGIGGQKCTPEQNRENRRTEIYIPGFLRAEPVKQEKGDYSNGRANAPANYSSLKEHGSIFDQVPDGTKPQQDQKAPSASAKVPQLIKEQTVSVPNTTVSDMANYYLVLGSFQDENSAIKYAEQLKLQGYQAVVCSESAPFRVGIGYQRFSQAKNQLDAMKGIQQAWILKK
jgi:outer membrane protein OmpA-like peptidoglycan-associated protein